MESILSIFKNTLLKTDDAVICLIINVLMEYVWAISVCITECQILLSLVISVNHSFKLMSKIWPQGLLPGEHSNATLHIPAGAKSFVENKDSK